MTRTPHGVTRKLDNTLGEEFTKVGSDDEFVPLPDDARLHSEPPGESSAEDLLYAGGVAWYTRARSCGEAEAVTGGIR